MRVTRKTKAKVIRDEKWHRRFLALAEHIAQWSKDPSTKTGAVIVDSDNRIVSVGYNGFPKGVKDLANRLNNRDLKYKIIVHCERNALLFARGPVAGCKLYVWPFVTCTVCASMAIQAGIAEVIAPTYDNHPASSRWRDDFKFAESLLKEARVKVTLL